jgi:hypothetical protein
MKRSRRGLLLLLGMLLVPQPQSHGIAPDDKDDPVPVVPKLERGLTPDQVRDRVGPPKHVSRQILYHRYLEQWTYEAPAATRVTFDCPRGQKPQLLGTMTLTTGKGR